MLLRNGNVNELQARETTLVVAIEGNTEIAQECIDFLKKSIFFTNQPAFSFSNLLVIRPTLTGYFVELNCPAKGQKVILTTKENLFFEVNEIHNIVVDSINEHFANQNVFPGRITAELYSYFYYGRPDGNMLSISKMANFRSELPV